MREVASRIIKKAPCKYRLVRNLSCLDPRKMVASKGNWRNLYSCNYHIPVCKYSGISTKPTKLTCRLYVYTRPGTKTIKKNTNSTQNKSETHRAKQYEVTSFLSTDCELSTETCSKNVYSLGPLGYTLQTSTVDKKYCAQA